MGNLSKPYTISIWDEVWDENEGKFVEERFAIIGANTMQSQNRALEPTLTRNVNGSKKFSFKICKRYKDSITGEVVINPFAEYLISERKIKLEYDGEWFDFIIKNISEDSSKYIYTYQCEDALVNELSKNGFGVKLDQESVNNSGTLEEIATIVLEDTDWEIESDTIVQTIEEPLVYILIPANTTIVPVLDQDENDKRHGVSQGTPIKLNKASKALAFYSSCRNKPTHFQFIYFSDEKKYGKGVVEHNEDRIITERDCQYYIEYLDPDKYNVNVKDYGFELPEGFKLAATSGGLDDKSDTTISTWHRGARYVFSQKSIYEPKLKRYVTQHTGPDYKELDKNGEEVTKNEYRSYSSSEYISPELVPNIITNTDFKVDSGWTGTHFANEAPTEDNGIKKATVEAVYGRFDGDKFVSAITDLSAGNTNYDKQYTKHKAYMKISMPKNTYVVNSGPYDNRSSIGQMEIGSEWALSLKNRKGNDLSNVEYELGEYKYNAKTNGYKKIESGITFTRQPEKVDGFIIFKVTSNPYINKKDFKENSNVRLRIKNTKDGTNTQYIESAFLFRVHYDKNNNIVVPDGKLSNQSEEIGFVEEKYYYYKPSEVDNIAEAEEFQPSISLDKPTYTTYAPIFHMDAEKIRSVTAKDSNYFNILQTLAETFETWMLIDVERNASGQITHKKIKYKQYIGEKNYANFRYGVNLKDIKRVFESKSLVTKLIVKDNSNEFAKNGFCTVARAKANPLGENCLYDFQYYFNTGIMNARDHLDTMYTVDKAMGKDRNTDHTKTNAIGYYPRVRAINDKLDSFTETITALNTGLIRLKADAEVEKAAIAAAESGAEEAADSFAFLTGRDIRNFKSGDIDGYDSRSDVHKQLTAYTTCMTELGRATAEYDRLNELIKTRESQIKTEQDKFNTWRNYKIALNKAFYTKYSRFIQEGTWIDEEYLDDEKYYADAQSVLYNSCYPQVTYSINVLALSALPGYEMFKFGLGDRTFVEDPEFFGREYKEEVVLTEFVENLDSPEKNTIKVQNFKNQFQDLFQKITATVQQAQYRTGSYEKAAALAEAASARKYQFLTDALAGAEAILSAAGQQTVIVDKSGITVTDDDSPCNQIRLIGGAILISTDDGNGVKKWKTAMTHQGISASLITAGVINAGEICIMNNQEPAFRWDAFGLSAFGATWHEGVVSGIDYHQFVRMDKYGLYGMRGDDPFNNNAPDGRTWHATSEQDIDNYASFSLTWNGLKVMGEDNVVARIGRQTQTEFNTEKNSSDKSAEDLAKERPKIINISKMVKDAATGKNKLIQFFTVDVDGQVSIKVVDELEAAMLKITNDIIAAKVSKDSKKDGGENTTRYCEWTLTPEAFKVTAYKGSKNSSHSGDTKQGSIEVTTSGLKVEGILTALDGGDIGGFSIKGDCLYSGKQTLTSNVAGVYLGTNGISLGTSGNDPAFVVTSAGKLTARSATIYGDGEFSGSLKAASGTFAGSLSAATGTFAGSLSAATGTFAGALKAATGTFAGSLSAATGTFAGSLSAATGSFTSGSIGGMKFYSTSSGAVLGVGNSNDNDPDNLTIKGTLYISNPTTEYTNVASYNVAGGLFFGTNKSMGIIAESAGGGYGAGYSLRFFHPNQFYFNNSIDIGGSVYANGGSFDGGITCTSLRVRSGNQTLIQFDSTQVTVYNGTSAYYVPWSRFYKNVSELL